MNAPATIHLRPRARDLGDVPLDLDLAQHARLTLKPRELGAWFNLRTHLWVAGDLPVGTRAMARIAGIGPISFEKMMPALAGLFDRDEMGRWRDLDLEDERARRLDLDPGEERTYAVEQRPVKPVDPALSEIRRRAGARGGRSRVERLKLIQGGRVDATDGQAKSTENEANGQANDDALPPGCARSLPSFASAGGQSLSVGLPDSKQNSEEQTDRQASKPAGASEAKPDAPPQANPPAAAQANDGSPPSPKDDEIIRTIMSAYDGKVDGPHVHKRIGEVREWIAKGCSLSLDIVPECRDFARGKQTIANCFNEIVKKAAFQRREYRLRSGLGGRPEAKVYLYVGSPEFEAHEYFEGRKQKRDYYKPGETRPGWFFATQWPDGWIPGASLEQQPRRRKIS